MTKPDAIKMLADTANMAIIFTTVFTAGFYLWMAVSLQRISTALRFANVQR